jgi:hypothetical protein
MTHPFITRFTRKKSNGAKELSNDIQVRNSYQNLITDRAINMNVEYYSSLVKF